MEGKHQSAFVYLNMEEVGKIIGKNKPLEILEGIITKKRLKWLNENRNKSSLGGSPIEQAYNIFYQECLGLTSDDVEIVVKSGQIKLQDGILSCP